jgi:adenylate cyclase
MRFGPIELRPVERQLYVQGRRMPLGARSFDLLLMLAERGGGLVTKRELLDGVWSGLVVEEANVPVRVSELRKLLGSDAIVTVPGLGYRFALPADEDADAAAHADAAARASPVTGAQGPTEPVAAVLAFDGFSAGSEERTLGEGFADDLITELARQRGLVVLARHTSFSVARLGLTAAAIAARLRVKYLVEGSVRRVGEQFIVNVQLVDDAGRHLWAERFAYGAADIYLVQQCILEQVAAALFSGIRRSETAASLRKPPASLDVYELTLRGAAHERMQTGEGMRAGRVELERAVALDAGYAPARVWLGYLLATDATSRLSGTLGPADLPAAIAHIRAGIALDPDLPLGYQALGFALSFTEQLDEALVAAQRAVALAPGDADNLMFLSRAQLVVGQYEAALAQVQRAIALNPHTPPMYLVQRARALYALDRHDEASHAAHEAVLAAPAARIAMLFGAAADIARGDAERARARVAALLQHDPAFTLASPVLQPYFARDPERRLRLHERLRQAGVPPG